MQIRKIANGQQEETLVLPEQATSGRKEENNDKQAAAAEKQNPSIGVSLKLSGEGMQRMQKQSAEDEQEADRLSEKADKASKEWVLKTFQQELESTKEASKEGSDVSKILEIARRISNGDRVPYTDEEKLIEYNRALYQAAKAAAMLNSDKEHKDYDALFDEEDVDNASISLVQHQEPSSEKSQ